MHGSFVTISGTELLIASLTDRCWFSPWLRTRQRESVAEACGGRHQRTGGHRVTAPRNSHFSTTTCTGRCHLSKFASLPCCPVGVTVQDAVTHAGYVDDMATGKPALFKRGLFSLPRVQAGLVPLSSVVPPRVRSFLEDDATSPLLQRDCTERFDGKLAFDTRHSGNPRLYGRFLGDLFAKGLIAMGTAKARVAPLLFQRKTVANARFSTLVKQIAIHITCKQPEFVIASVATRYRTCQGPG